MSTTGTSTTGMSSTEAILGRTDVNDLDAILDLPNPYAHEVLHAVKDNADAIFTWDYEKGARPALNKLYEKAKDAQWNGETDLDWSIEVDQERQAAQGVSDAKAMISPELLAGTCFASSATPTGCSSTSSRATGCCRSSCTASRARWCARPRSSRRSRGSTPSTTPPRR